MNQCDKQIGRTKHVDLWANEGHSMNISALYMHELQKTVINSNIGINLI